MRAVRPETAFVSTVFGFIAVVLPACWGSEDDDTAGETDVVDEAQWTPELLRINRAKYICENHRVAAQADMGETSEESCFVDANSFMFNYIPDRGYFSPDLASACVTAAEDQTTYDFWLWCFSAWVY